MRSLKFIGGALLLSASTVALAQTDENTDGGISSEVQKLIDEGVPQTGEMGARVSEIAKAHADAMRARGSDEEEVETAEETTDVDGETNGIGEAVSAIAKGEHEGGIAAQVLDLTPASDRARQAVSEASEAAAQGRAQAKAARQNAASARGNAAAVRSQTAAARENVRAAAAQARSVRETVRTVRPGRGR